jgi:hypothetical protein
MLRAVLSVLLGYAVLVLCVMVTYTLLWVLVGQEAAFRPGTTEVTATWLAFALPLSFVAAALGGLVAVRVARSRARGATLGLAGLVFLLGVASALGEPGPETPAAAPGEISAFEAATQARQPGWVAWILPFLGAAGVVAGGAVALRGGPPAPEAAGP